MTICKLCKRERELKDSHFLPAAVYAQLKVDGQKNSNPVLISSDISLATSKQITGRVLCGECEQLFSKNGEAWVLGNMWRQGGFPIQDAMAAGVPIQSNDKFAYYSSIAMPAINMTALVYFAMSIFWRSSAHLWRNGPRLMEGIDLGPFEEPIRTFLLGGPFPRNTVILVSVWPTKDVLPASYTPRRGRMPGCHCFNFLIPGLEFKLLTGQGIPEVARAACSHASKDKLIFSAMSVVTDTLEAFTNLAGTSRPSKGLQKATKALTTSSNELAKM
jgi:hypothetical protein